MTPTAHNPDTREKLAINDTWLSGKPYYCATCGLGYAEWLACEGMPDCKLESEKAAQDRLSRARNGGQP